MSSTRSTFPTVVGWIFAVLSGFGVTVGVMQNIMLHVAFPMEEFTTDIPTSMPPLARWMFEHFELMVLIPLLVFSLLLAGSVGLIKRWEWARKLMVVVMVLLALWSMGSIVFQFFWVDQMDSMTPGAPAAFQTMRTVMMVFSLLWGLAFAALFGWIAKRLASWDIKQEFGGRQL